MRIYFYDESGRYIGNRGLVENESIPHNATTENATVGDGQEAYLVDGKWVVNDIVVETYTFE